MSKVDKTNYQQMNSQNTHGEGLPFAAMRIKERLCNQIRQNDDYQHDQAARKQWNQRTGVREREYFVSPFSSMDCSSGDQSTANPVSCLRAVNASPNPPVSGERIPEELLIPPVWKEIAWRLYVAGGPSVPWWNPILEFVLITFYLLMREKERSNGV